MSMSRTGSATAMSRDSTSRRACLRLLPMKIASALRPCGRVRMFRTDGGETGSATGRSEEHTSELQSRGHLVCRLLLEKKKTKTNKKRENMINRMTKRD